MDLAPIQLTDYFVHSLNVEALPSYDTSQAAELDIEALTVEAKCFQPDDQAPRHFGIDLVIKQAALESKNLPYSYELHMIGFIEVMPNVPQEAIKRIAEINGPTMLFGAAREILRAATGRGPYGPVLIPSTTFYKAPPAKKTAKKATKKSAMK
jgi:preprotein translocase subunit SecB